MRITFSIRLFGIIRPTNRMFVQLVVELAGDAPVGSAGQVREVRDHGQDAGLREAKRLELLPVELRVAEREIAAVDVRLQLAASLPAQLHELLVNADEVLGRRDVVVDQRHPVRQRVGDAAGPRPDREVVDQQVVGMAGIHQIAVVVREVLEARVRRLDEDLRVVAGRPAARAGSPSTSWPMASP